MMARLLDKLASQPTPLFKRLNLDAQPERPFLQRLLTRLPQRRAGERYAFRPAPLAFLAWQPQRPLLSGLQFRDQPRIGPDTWLRKAPLESLAGPGQPLLGKMDSQRMPGVVLALLLLGLSLNYLLNLSDGAGTPADETLTEASFDNLEAEVINDNPVAAEEAEPATAALTPAEEADISSEIATSKTSNEEAMVAATTANLMAAAPPVAEKPSAKSKENVAAESVNKKAETSTAAKTETSRPKAGTAAEPAAEARPAPEIAAPAAANSVKAKASPAPASKTATEISLSTAAETAPDPEAKTTLSEVPVTSIDGSADNQPAKAMAADSIHQTTRETAPEVINPRRLSAERSHGILNSSRVIYLLGDGPLALERLGLALSAGHVHVDYIDAFRKMEADIRQLLDLFEIANNAKSPKMAAVSRAAFMDAEQALFPHESSAYAARLETSAASELNSY